jgi:hypothetical protein
MNLRSFKTVRLKHSGHDNVEWTSIFVQPSDEYFDMTSIFLFESPSFSLSGLRG